MLLPKVIQGGMGIGISNWKLAREVALVNEMGVVSGTCINTLLIRRLQDGDKDGTCREALKAFPFQEISEKILKDYFLPNGRAQGAPYKRGPMFSLNASKELLQLNATASFVEVYLAKKGHSGVVGINLLEKVQLPNLSTLFGAMIAGVDYVLMGAGIPREIPGVLDRFSKLEKAELKIAVEDSLPTDDYRMTFDPHEVFGAHLPWQELKRPYFLAIVSSAVLALNLARKSTGRVDGFIIEGPTAGGHNAPPRGQLQLNLRGEPIYGDRDVVDLDKMKDIGLPFWLAGSYGHPVKLKEAIDLGAAGIQVGTAFAFSIDSGLENSLRKRTLEKVEQGIPAEKLVFTDPLASPTGFPFKLAILEDTLSFDEIYQKRNRICDLGYLRRMYKKEDGSLGYRCPAEPNKDFIEKKGEEIELKGRKCLCNALFANIGLPQVQKGGAVELPLLTTGDDLANLGALIKQFGRDYSAQNVVAYLKSAL